MSSYERDINELGEIVEEWRNRPRDVVPKQPYTGDYDDVVALAGKSVELRYVDEDGGHTEQITVGKPILPSDERNE